MAAKTDNPIILATEAREALERFVVENDDLLALESRIGRFNIFDALEKVLADTARLQVADRIQLFDAIWVTLPADSLPPLTDEWLAEIQRRSAEYDSGSGETVSWE